MNRLEKVVVKTVRCCQHIVDGIVSAVVTGVIAEAAVMTVTIDNVYNEIVKDYDSKDQEEDSE